MLGKLIQKNQLQDEKSCCGVVEAAAAAAAAAAAEAGASLSLSLSEEILCGAAQWADNKRESEW